MINVNVFSEDNNWSNKIKNKEIFFQSICDAFPRKYKFSSKNVSFTLLLSNNKNIKKLNKKFRNKNKHTDILSFPFEKKVKIKYVSSNIRIGKTKIDNIIIHLAKGKYQCYCGSDDYFGGSGIVS